MVTPRRPRLPDAARAAAHARRLVALARPHGLFLALTVAGIALRVLTMVAYRPALVDWDSRQYLTQSTHLVPDPLRPFGYPLFLKVVSVVPGLLVVPLVQHLIGLLMGALIYLLLVRLGVRRWAAALAAAPVLLDAYQVILEQYVLSETLFDALILVACAALLWRPRPRACELAAAGLLLALAAVTRANGFVAIGPATIAALCLCWRRRAPRGPLPRRLRLGSPTAAVAIVLAAFLLPLAAYAGWYHDAHGSYAITGQGGPFLYARVAPFADCSKFSVPAAERVLCPLRPVGSRPRHHGSAVEYYRWARSSSPLYKVRPAGRQADLARDFAERVIVNQPSDYFGTVAHDFLRGFAPLHTRGAGELPLARWQFQTTYPTYFANEAAYVGSFGDGRPQVMPRLAGALREYQRFGFTPGPLLAFGALAALLAAFGFRRARGSGLRSAAFLLAATGLVVFGSTVLAGDFTWRYQISEIIFLPPAAAVGLTALTRRRTPDR